MPKKERICPGKDTFERMNFLYQAATIMAGNNNVLSCYYAGQCKSIGRKSVLRMEPNMKRTICKRCGLILRPGISADLNIESQHKRKSCKIKCFKCGYQKNFVLNENYNSWYDNEASIKETNESTDSVSIPQQPAIPKQSMMDASSSIS